MTETTASPELWRLVQPARERIDAHAADLRDLVDDYAEWLTTGNDPMAWAPRREREGHEPRGRIYMDGERGQYLEMVYRVWERGRRAERARHRRDRLAEQLFVTLLTGEWHRTTELAETRDTSAAAIYSQAERIAELNPHLALERRKRPTPAIRLVRATGVVRCEDHDADHLPGSPACDLMREQDKRAGGRVDGDLVPPR